MRKSYTVSCVQNKDIRGYCSDSPFDPSEIYPEMKFIRNTDEKNKVYAIVRELFRDLRMDKQNIGSLNWNPLKEIIQPGDKVLIKPNLVIHNHYLGKDALYGSVVHASTIRPIIDYAYKALQGKGTITIADNPVESAEFSSLMEFTGIRAMTDELQKRGYEGLRLIDLRPKVLKESKSGKFYYESQTGDPLGYVTIDLGKDSMFSELDKGTDIHYYTLADSTIDHIDPKCVRESLTDKYHNPKRHEYIVSKTVLDADVIINISKMKTHCKAGVTLSLKNMIGITYMKECMPHHRPGPPPEGDSFPYYPPAHYVASKKLYKKLRETIQVHRVPGFRALRNYMQKKGVLIGQHIEHGNWKGNDTIWRTILDLNRIAIYADKQGIMHDTPQRKIFCIVDGIVAQQGDGPMAGEPVNASIIFGGFNPVLVDALAVKSMGIDYGMIKTIAKADEIKKLKLMPDGPIDLSLPDIDVPVFNFKLPKGWR